MFDAGVGRAERSETRQLFMIDPSIGHQGVHAMTVSELRSLIQDAWSDAKHPGDIDTSADPGSEAMQVVSFFRGKAWKDITLEALRTYPGDASKCLNYMSAVAFRYYIPAFMLMALDKYEDQGSSAEAWVIAASAVYSLGTLSADLFKSRVAAFSVFQRKTIVEFLRFIACNCSEDYPMDEPQRAYVHWLSVI